MAITSHAFGRVTLTEDDADKFANQVRYGRTNQAAKDAVGRGLSMAEAVKDSGKFKFTVTKPTCVKRKTVVKPTRAKGKIVTR